MQVGLIAASEIRISDKYPVIAYRMSRVPAVWRYAGRAVGADRDMLVSLLLDRPNMEDEMLSSASLRRGHPAVRRPRGCWWACIGHEVFRDPAGLTMACSGPVAGHHLFFSVLAAAGR